MTYYWWLYKKNAYPSHCFGYRTDFHKNLRYALLWGQRKFNMVDHFAKAKSRFQWKVSWSAVQAEGVNVMVNSIHPGCIDTNFGKGEIPFLANKVVRGESYYSTSGIGWIQTQLLHMRFKEMEDFTWKLFGPCLRFRLCTKRTRNPWAV